MFVKLLRPFEYGPEPLLFHHNPIAHYCFEKIVDVNKYFHILFRPFGQSKQTANNPIRHACSLTSLKKMVICVKITRTKTRITRCHSRNWMFRSTSKPNSFVVINLPLSPSQHIIPIPFELTNVVPDLMIAGLKGSLTIANSDILQNGKS
jgi:hypothetical protein